MIRVPEQLDRLEALILDRQEDEREVELGANEAREEIRFVRALGERERDTFAPAREAAQERVDAGTAAMIVYVSPVLIAIFAGVFLREGFSRELFVGCAIALAGVALIGFASATRTATTVGVLLCLVAAVALASGAVTQKVVLRRLSGLQTITACCAIGVAVLLPFAPSLVDELGRAPTDAVVWTIYLGVLPTAIGFLTWAFALSRRDAGRLGGTIYLVPAVSVVLAWLMLGETPRALALLGGALCLVGVAVAGGLVRIRSRDAPSGRRRRRRPRLHSRESPAEP